MKFLRLCLFSALCAYARSPQQTVPSNPRFEDLAQKTSAALESDPRQAVSFCRQALALQPSWAEGWFDLGAASYKLAEYSEARRAFEHAAQLAPQKGAVWAFLGLAEYRLPEYASALKHIQHAESLGLPDNPGFVSTVRTTAAAICIRAREFSAAVDQLKPLALLGDNSQPTIDFFGVSALALPYVPPDIPPDKKPMVALAGRVEWALCAKRDAEASKALSDLLAAYPKQPGVHYLKGIYLLASDPEPARAEFQKELEISPNHVAARLQIAILDIRAGEPAPAAQLALAALRLQPDNVLAHVVLGRARMQQNEYAKAMPELQAAAKLAPLNPEIHLYLEQVYAHLGRSSDAQIEKAEFLRLHSASNAVAMPELDAATTKR